MSESEKRRSFRREMKVGIVKGVVLAIASSVLAGLIMPSQTVFGLIFTTLAVLAFDLIVAGAVLLVAESAVDKGTFYD